ncbi:Uncharacterised protein [Bacteroides thetaiotaomicron]|uniref:Uncharacterized protein n=1 Tax=Bacteroides thetaiotaomicron TaxID=818 RepID=A0A174NS89_BACT4|nr:Uncharacterised protein [Bacteroides thetaiotaomicron]
MVVAYALKFAMLSVQIEAFVGNIFNAADTEAGRVCVYQLVVRVHFRYSLVKSRAFRRPELRRVDDKVLFKGLSVVDAAFVFFAGHYLSVRRQDFRFYMDFRLFAGVLYLGLQAYGGKFIADVRGSNLRAPYRNVYFVRHDQVDVAVQTCSRIPA